jgi:(2R)-3-sulfolactate dehydrogenase (NADP+)
LFVAIDPGALAGNEDYLQRVETLVEAMLEEEGVRLPGARRENMRKLAEQDGIEIDDRLYRELSAQMKLLRVCR